MGKRTEQTRELQATQFIVKQTELTVFMYIQR